MVCSQLLITFLTILKSQKRILFVISLLEILLDYIMLKLFCEKSRRAKFMSKYNRTLTHGVLHSSTEHNILSRFITFD